MEKLVDAYWKIRLISGLNCEDVKLSELNSYKSILKLAIPSIFGFLGILVFETIDIYWIGKLDPRAVAAVASAAFLEWTIFTLTNLTRTGTVSLVSKAYGAKNIKLCHQIAVESIYLSLIVSIFLTILSISTCSWIFWQMGLDEKTHQFAMEYFVILMLGLPFFYLFNLAGDILNSYSNTKASMITMWISISANIVFAPILVFGWFGFPALAVKGAALATVISYVVGICTRFFYLVKKNYIPHWKEFIHPPVAFFQFWKQFLSIGAPSAATNAIWCMVFPFLTVLITKFGMMPLAGLNIGNRIEAVCYYAAMGVSVAVATLVGQSLGRKDPSACVGITFKGLVIVSTVLMPLGVYFLLYSSSLASLLNTNPEIVYHAGSYLKIVASLGIFLGFEMVLEGAFNGLGNTKPYMMVRVPLTIARIPLAYVLAFHTSLGVSGIWWSISLTTLLKGLALVWLFVYNKKNREILGLA
jgi:putative MATE family efflux protein